MRRASIPNLAFLSLAALSAVVLPVASTHAESAQVIQLAKGTGGPQTKNGGPGNEQPTSVVLQKNGKTYVVTLYMSSDIPDNDRPWQCKCTSIEMSPTAGPLKVVDQKQLTKYDGIRPCNHPMAATDGQHVVWAFGSDKANQGTTATYAGVLNEMCETEVAPIKISNNGNNNEGAPDISYNGNGYFTAGYLSTGNNDTSFARGLVLKDTGGTVTLDKTYLKGVVAPSNIGRPAIVAAGPDRSLFCASKGDNRPPEVGVECAWLNAIDGTIVQKSLVAPSQLNVSPKVYMNQPSLALLDYGRFALNVQASNGQGKNTNVKGSNVSHLYILEPSDGGIVEKAHQKGVGTYQTHAAICGGKYGETGERAVAVMGAPITGVGQPGFQFANYSSTQGLTVDPTQQWVIGYYGDSGHLANLYGANPKNQGRDFLRCIGDVPNPGHGVKGGYMSNVETFFVAPHAGRIPGDTKNALFLSLVPGKTDIPVQPEPPQEVPETTSSSSSGVGGSEPTSSSSTTGGGVGGSPGGNNEFPSGETGGCACATAGAGAEGGLGAFAALGLMLAFIYRRKEH